MFQNYRTLLLNGKRFSASQLKALCARKLKSSSIQKWEHALYGFIAEWLNESPAVSARTSGTTGTPKEISIAKDKMLHSANLTVRQLHLQPGSTALVCLSCGHIAGKMMVVRAFAGGLNLVAAEPASNPLESIPISQPIDFAAFVPMQMQEMLNDKKTIKRFEKIGKVLAGGGPISNELKSRIQKMPNAVYETFGMTETISHIALKKLSAGSEYFTTLDGITVAADDRSCLVVSAPFISNEPVITNDIVKIKDNRNFKWLGRFDHVINSGGIKLLPESLEEKIRDTMCRKYFFKGAPDEKLGTKLVLVIEGERFSETELNRLKKDLKRVLDKYEIPKEIIFIPEFNTTASGKIKR